MFFTIGEVLLISVEFAYEYRIGIISVFGFVSFNGDLESLAFIEIVPAELFNRTIFIENCDFQFGSKLDSRFPFFTY